MIKIRETMDQAELWRQIEAMQAKMDAAIAERDAAIARVENPVVAEALGRLREEGFLGRYVASLSVGDERHELHIVTAEFENGTSIYVVAADRHEGGGRPSMLPLSEAVHILQNITEPERWAIGSREVGS